MNRTALNQIRSLTGLLAITFGAIPASAATLKPETLAAWNAYVQTAEGRMQSHLQPGQNFLWVDEDHMRVDQVHSRRPFISPVDNNPKRVPNGLIHDWMGAIYIPNVSIDDVLSTVRDYDQYKEFYNPVVVKSHGSVNGNPDDRFSMVLMNKSVFSKSALDSDYKSKYVKLDAKRWYSISETTRIQEVEHYGEENAQVLPVDEGTGLIWRLMSMTRFEERDGGVYVEVEAIALSRDIPGSLRWIVTPIVKRVSKGSLTTSLTQTEQAVETRVQVASRRPVEEHSGRTPATETRPVVMVSSFH
jgi:hypothetical protein